MDERCPVIPVAPPTLWQKVALLALVAATVAIALCGCCPRYQQRKPHEELTDCLYHARFEFGLSEPERQDLERSCRAIYDMRQRERMQ